MKVVSKNGEEVSQPLNGENPGDSKRQNEDDQNSNLQMAKWTKNLLMDLDNTIEIHFNNENIKKNDF